MKKFNIKLGDIYGDLKCISIYPPNTKSDNKSTLYEMECLKCHRRKLMLGSTIRLEHGITHKACGKGLKLKDPIFYDRWKAMRTRTNNPNYEHYKDYGGRGINSDVFEYFIDFYDAMYESFKLLANQIGPNNVSLERLDVDGNYCPQNCIWIPIWEQQSNTRKNINFTIQYPNGDIEIRKSLNLFCKQNGLNYSSVYHHSIYNNGYIDDNFIIKKINDPINLVLKSESPIQLVSFY